MVVISLRKRDCDRPELIMKQASSTDKEMLINVTPKDTFCRYVGLSSHMSVKHFFSKFLKQTFFFGLI